MTIKAFLGTYGTPSKVLEAPDEELESFIDPLGLQETRIKAVKQMSQAFFDKVRSIYCPSRSQNACL